jgi:hypothetical protein
MTALSDYPMNRAPRCGARNRAGHPCRSPALRGKKRCRLHGGWSPGAPRGELHPNFRHGKFSKLAKEVGVLVRQLARAADVKTATVMHAHGLKPLKAIRRRRHVKRALAKAKEQPK